MSGPAGLEPQQDEPCCIDCGEPGVRVDNALCRECQDTRDRENEAEDERRAALDLDHDVGC